jgi:hypothetical protein
MEIKKTRKRRAYPLDGMTPEERKARKAAIRIASYHARKNDPGRREAVNEANLARYHAKKGNPGILESLRERSRLAYDERKDDPEYKKVLSERFRRSAEKRMWDGITRGAIKRAIARNLPYDADLLEWAPTAWTGKCALSGIEFRRSTGSGPNPFSPSIDRIVPGRSATPRAIAASSCTR